MRINDKLMTVVTGAVLAIGGAIVSLTFGEQHRQTETSDVVVVAGLSVPAQGQGIAAGTDRDVIVAAIEPETRAQTDGARIDLAGISIFDGEPVLAAPSEFSEIIMTRTPVELATPAFPKIVLGTPDVDVNIADLVQVPLVEAASCGLDVRATPIFGARVELKVVAPCHPDVVATIKHAGLTFKERLDAQGILELKVPAFAEYARFDIALADGTTSVVGAYVAGLSSLERVGIAWEGENDTFLHALQNGAALGSEGHIWRLNPASFAQARMSGGGYMSMLGNPELDDAALVQVYTLPMRARARAQIVELQIETLRGDTACGQEMAMRIAHHRVKSGAAQSEVSVTLPACGSEQDSLVLKNTVKDMKVARK